MCPGTPREDVLQRLHAIAREGVAYCVCTYTGTSAWALVVYVDSGQTLLGMRSPTGCRLEAELSCTPHACGWMKHRLACGCTDHAALVTCASWDVGELHPLQVPPLLYGVQSLARLLLHCPYRSKPAARVKMPSVCVLPETYFARRCPVGYATCPACQLCCFTGGWSWVVSPGVCRPRVNHPGM